MATAELDKDVRSQQTEDRSCFQRCFNRKWCKLDMRKPRRLARSKYSTKGGGANVQCYS
jgi:hypothetical protein